MIERPIMLLGFSLVTCVFIFGIIVQLFERYAFVAILKNSEMDQFLYIQNVWWLLIQSMSGVGYGDIVPQTNIGRAYMIISCYIGNGII
jgi:hypothetical protein